MTPRRRIIPVFVPHLGCPHTCVFCNQRHISGETERQTAERVRDIIRRGLENAGCDEVTVAFYGGSFTAIPAAEQEELLGAAQPFIRDGRVKSLRLSTRPDAVDGETVKRLLRFGVKTVELGVQSMDEDVLTLSKRGHTAEDAERAAHLLKDAGLEVILQMMTGLPGDTPEKSLYTARKFAELKPDGVRIYPTVVIRDTELCEMRDRGEYREHTVEEATELCAEIAEIFDAAGIPVIRLGLNPTDDLSGGEAVGGAYHPALGELVLGRRYLKRELPLLSADDAGRDVTFFVAKGAVSAASGQKRCNAKYLKEKFGINSVRFREDASLGKLEVRRGDL